MKQTRINVSENQQNSDDIDIFIKETNGHGASLTTKEVTITISKESIGVVINLVEALRKFGKEANIKQVEISKTKQTKKGNNKPNDKAT